MAEKKFSQLTAKGATIADTDLVAISESAGGGSYVSKSVTGANIKALVTDANLTTTDITTNNVSTSKHGFAPKAPNDATQFLDGTGAYDTVKDSDLSLSDITTNDVSITKHGFVPKLPNNTTTFLRGDGTWATAGTSTGRFGIADSSGAYTYYTTLSLAITAATAGQTIEFFTDFTESTVTAITLKNGVNINGNGHTYSYTAATGNCFIDGGAAVTCQVANLKISRTNYTSGSVYVQSSSSSDTDWVGSQIFATAGANDMFNILGTLRNCWVKVTGNGTAITSNYTSNAKFYNCYGESTGSGTGLNCRTATVVNSTGISVSGNGAYGDQSVFSNCYLYSASGYGVFYGQYTNCTMVSISGQSSRLINRASNCVLLNTSGPCAVNQDSSFYNCTMITSSSDVTLFISYNYNCFMYSATNRITSGYNPYFYGCTLQTGWNNASGHCLNAATEVVNCTLIVTNASANCLNNASALTVKYANNSFKGATTPVNANITQGIVNTQDNQGNILL